jgi:hypothetical protein
MHRWAQVHIFRSLRFFVLRNLFALRASASNDAFLSIQTKATE